MTKRKLTIPTEIPVEVDPESAPEPEPAPPTNPYYTIKVWAGHPQWQCNFCAFDTLEGEGDILNHIATRHLASNATQPLKSSIILTADKSGREKKGI